MSLKVDESGRRGRSKSPGGRRVTREPEPDYEDMGMGMPVPGGFGPPSDDDDDDDRRRRDAKRRSPPEGVRSDAYRRSREDANTTAATVASSGRRDKEYYRDREREDRDRDRDRDRNRERERDGDRGGRNEGGRPDSDVLQYLPQKYATKYAERDSDREREAARGGRKGGKERESPSYSDEEEDHRRAGRRTKDSRRYDDDDDDDGDDLAYGKDPPYGSMSAFFPPESPRESPRESRDRFDRPSDRPSLPPRRDDSEEERRREYERAMKKLLKGGEAPPGDSKKKRDKKDKDKERDKDRERDRDRGDRDRSGAEVKFSNGDKTYSANASYGRRKNGDDDDSPPSPSRDRKERREQKSYLDPRGSSSNVLTVDPGSQRRERSRDRRGDDKYRRDSSPQPPSRGMASLTVATAHHGANLTVANAPASPLLESYKGTYQSMSPMPSPMMLPSGGKGDPLADMQVVDLLSPLDSDDGGNSEDDRSGKKKKVRRARFSDPVDDASRLAAALKGEKRAPDLEPLVEILPGLTHEQMVALRAQYKALVKTGSERKGVNLAKHIRARLKDADPSLMKACYATSLGRWESEAYWANFWYQGDKTRRELLIESLMGRPEDEIERIKDGFSDKKYDNSLARCMRTELKEDKFKRAIMTVLEGRRMAETALIDPRLVDEDVRELYKCVKADKGGESAMIAIVVSRSDTHLREVLRVYNKTYRANFAKDALRKSGNLVGELLAHILNGVINKPVRDALLVHHAVTASRRDDLRRELLTSRLIRYHWDPAHMLAVKRAYRERYGADLAEAVHDATATGNPEWAQFCRNLCITRMPDHVKRFEKPR